MGLEINTEQRDAHVRQILNGFACASRTTAN